MQKLIGTLLLAVGLAVQSGCEIEAVTDGSISGSSAADEYYYELLGTWGTPATDSYYSDSEYYATEWITDDYWIEGDDWYYDEYYDEWYYYDYADDEWYYYDEYITYDDSYYYEDSWYYDDYEGAWYYYDEYTDEWYYEDDWY